MALGEISSALSILEKLWNWFRSWRTKTVPPPESVATRFVRLFESHGVHRNQIPRFFGCGLTPKDVQDDASLLLKLDEPMLEAACARFAVRREWLDGAESQVHPCHDFYKHPEAFLRFVDDLRLTNSEEKIEGVLIAPINPNFRTDALLILQETIGHVGEKAIYRFHLCNNWLYKYWKARAYLTACVAIAWKRGIYIYGTKRSYDEIVRFAYGKTLLGWNGEGIWALGHRTWYAEDMALRPDEFLSDIDPEKDNFGIKSGLKLWLKLEEQGLMDTGIEGKARRLFEEELTKLQSQSGKKALFGNWFNLKNKR